jgi:hypothetical protein
MSKRLQPVLDRLANRETILEYKESGNSMTPLIKSQQPVTLAPVDISKLEKGDIVLVKVKGNFYTHLVTAVEDERVQIGNNHGHINGWTSKSKVYGIVTHVDGKKISSATSKVLGQ